MFEIKNTGITGVCTDRKWWRTPSTSSYPMAKTNLNGGIQDQNYELHRSPEHFCGCSPPLSSYKIKGTHTDKKHFQSVGDQVSICFHQQNSWFEICNVMHQLCTHVEYQFYAWDLGTNLQGWFTQKRHFCYHSLFVVNLYEFLILWNTKGDFRQSQTLGHHSSSLPLGLYNECEYGLTLTSFVSHIKMGLRAKWSWEDNRSFSFFFLQNHHHFKSWSLG